MTLVGLVIYLTIGAIYTNYLWENYDGYELISELISDNAPYEDSRLALIITVGTFLLMSLTWPFTMVKNLVWDVRIIKAMIELRIEVWKICRRARKTLKNK